MIEKIGFFEIQNVNYLSAGQDCLVKLDEISVDRLEEFEGDSEEEKIKSFIAQSPKITMNTTCKIFKYREYKKPVI